MKTNTLTHYVKVKTESTKLREQPLKNGAETFAASTVFGGFWEAMLQPKETWKSTADIQKGEIEIPLPRFTKASEIADKSATSEAGREITTQTVVSPKSALNKLVVGEDRLRAQLLQASGNTLTEEVEPFHSESTAIPSERIKQVTGRILNALQESNALPSVQGGDQAKVEVYFTKEFQSDFSLKKKVSKTQNLQAKPQSLKTGSNKPMYKVPLKFHFSGKKGWEISNKALATGKGNLWKIRIVFADERDKSLVQSVSGKSKPGAPEKDVLITVLSARKAVKTAPQTNREFPLKLKVLVQDPSNTSPGKTVQAAGKPRQLTLSLGGNSGASGFANGQNAAEEHTHTPARFAATQEEASGISQNAKNGQNFTVTGDKAGAIKVDSPKKHDSVLWAKGVKSILKGGAQSMAALKAQARASTVRASALIERIEALVAQSAKAKNSGALKMQLSESPFGKMDLQFDGKENRLSVVLESEKAKQAFMRLIPLIRGNLADKGFVLSDVQVSVGQFAAQERHQAQSDQKEHKHTDLGKLERKEGDRHERTGTVAVRKFGYNTLEVTA